MKRTFDDLINGNCRAYDVFERGLTEEEFKQAREKMMKNTYLPMGSEGSLHKTIWINPDGNSLPRYTISIFGDLRDHDSTSEIIEWFKKKCKSLWVRNAVITVRNCWYGTETYTYEESEDEEAKDE